MNAQPRTRRRYDHRLQQLVHETGDIALAIERGVPRSTARDWLSSGPATVISVDFADLAESELRQEMAALSRRYDRLVAILRLVVVMVKVCGCTLERRRVADGRKKARLLRAIESSKKNLRLRPALRVLGLSAARYHSWKRDQDCQLDDVTSCPRSSPHQLTVEEVGVVKEMVTSEEYRHVPTGTLAVLAQRLGKVFASPSTWYRLVRVHRWRRPRRRVHPSRPKVGLRASRPNEYWHVDTTVIRLLDGSRAYLQAVIDNFSRKILAWRVSERFDPGNTVRLLVDASRHVKKSRTPTVLADGGVENFNSGVDDLIESGALRRLLAMTDVSFSNSLIESWWRVLKHGWLYLNSLDSVATVRKLVEFYVEEHNTRLPHSAFRGQTPDEMYFGTGDHVPAELEVAKRESRRARLAENRRVTCPACE